MGARASRARVESIFVVCSLLGQDSLSFSEESAGIAASLILNQCIFGSIYFASFRMRHRRSLQIPSSFVAPFPPTGQVRAFCVIKECFKS